jgi:hypothetical protein
MRRFWTTRPTRPRSNLPVDLYPSRASLWAVAALTVLAAGCPATGDEVRPPADEFYFPTGMDIAPDRSVLFVASANSDLRYDSGAVQVVDLDAVDRLLVPWLDPDNSRVPEGADCEVDLSVPYTLVCDEKEVIVADASVRIGNFATELKVQTLANSRRLRLFTAVRGDPSLTYIDYAYNSDGGELSCGPTGRFPECDDAHRLLQLRNDEDLVSLPDEPFGVYVDSENGYAIVTHLSNGAITLADAPFDGDEEPMLTDAIGNVFAPDFQTGARGAVGAAGRAPGSDNDRVYVTSRVDSRIQTLVVERGSGGFLSLVPAEYFFLGRSVFPSTNSRGIAFSADGNRAYIVNRAPPMLHIVDTSLDELGLPRNQFIGGVEICSDASNLAVVNLPEEEGEEDRGDRIFVACFRNGQVWSIDPRGTAVDAIIDVGRGPHAVVAAPERRRLYVSNNLESTVAVVNLEPESPTVNRVVLRLGRPRSSGDDE